MSDRPRSLRRQLLIFGLLATIIPIAVLLSTVVVTSTSSEISSAPDGSLTTESTTTDVPLAVPLVAGGVALAAAVAVWLWSAKAVKPMHDITALADAIQAGSLDRRLAMAGEAAEVQDLADSFDRMLDRLERSSRTQHELIEDVSHELRTPLAALAVNTEVIRRHPAPTSEDYEASLARSHDLIGRLQTTVDDLLRGARSRNREERQVDNDIVAIVQRVVDQHRSINPTVPVTLAGPVERLAPIDGPSVERAITNLVENAARFSPAEASVEIEISLDGPLWVSVTDRGPGIAPDDVDAVFDRYRRADEGGGHGIGLALVKQVADAHGAIRVESPPAGRSVGTRFILEFHDPPSSV